MKGCLLFGASSTAVSAAAAAAAVVSLLFSHWFCLLLPDFTTRFIAQVSPFGKLRERKMRAAKPTASIYI